MKQSQRIQLLYVLLKKATHTYPELIAFFKKEKVSIGLRQLQRDIKDLEMFLNEDEYLLKNNGEKKVLELTILQKINTEQTEHTNILTSEFGFSLIKEGITAQLNFLNKAILKKKILHIDELRDDATGFNSEFKNLKISLIPLCLIDHRSDYYLGFYEIKSNKYEIIQINQIKKINLRSEKIKKDYNKLQQDFKDYYKGLFGVSQNIDDKIHKIKLEFSSVTGSYVQQFKWHPSQQFKKQDGKLIMTLTCGINRELLGWISNWMYNVKIIAPPELINYYQKSNSMVSALYKSEPLVYKNIFKKK